MVEPNAKTVSITMGVLILIVLGSGITLFTLSAKAADKKTDELNKNIPPVKSSLKSLNFYL
jgi:hypothetical protein